MKSIISYDYFIIEKELISVIEEYVYYLDEHKEIFILGKSYWILRTNVFVDFYLNSFTEDKNKYHRLIKISLSDEIVINILELLLIGESIEDIISKIYKEYNYKIIGDILYSLSLRTGIDLLDFMNKYNIMGNEHKKILINSIISAIEQNIKDIKEPLDSLSYREAILKIGDLGIRLKKIFDM